MSEMEEAKRERPSINETDDVKIEISDARQATAKEHKLGVLQGLKPYRKAIGWSVLLSMAVIMEGYDTILVRLYGNG